MNGEQRSKLLTVLILLALALFTRFFGIGFQSLWIDEGSTYWFSHIPWDDPIYETEPNPHLFYSMEGFFLDIFGQTELALRFMPALTGALAVIAAFFVAEKLFGNRLASIVIAVLFLISPICLQYSQDGRGYGIILFIFLCQLYILLLILEKNRPVHWVILALLSVLGMSMQYVSLFGSFTLYAYALYHFGRDSIKDKEHKGLIWIFVSGVIFLIVSSPMLAHAYNAMMMASGSNKRSWCFTGFEYLINTLIDFLYSNPAFAAILLVFFVIGTYTCIKKAKDRAPLLLWISLFPLIFSTILSVMTNMTPKYILWALSGFYILIGCTTLNIRPDKESMKKGIAITAAIIMILACVALPIYYTKETKADFRGGCDALKDNADPGDVVLYAPDWENPVYATISFYYDADSEGTTIKGYTSMEELNAYVTDPAYGDVYVIILQDYDPYNLLSSTTSANCRCIFSGYDMSVYEVTGPL